MKRLRGNIAVFLLLLFSLLPAMLITSNQIYAASYSWDGGGLTNNWSDCANWSGDTCPGIGDAVSFSSLSVKDSVVDASFAGAITTINIFSGYSTGTVSLDRSLTVSNTFNQTGGTFTAGSQTLTTATFTFGGTGTFNASSGTTSVSSNLTIAGGTFNASGGTFNFNSTTSTRTLACNNVTFNLVTFTQTGGGYNVGSDCSLPLGNNPTLGNSSGNFTLNGTLSGTGTLFGGGGTKILSSGGALSGFTGLSMAALSVQGTYNFGSYTTFTTTGAFALGATGDITMPSGTASFGNNFTLNSSSTFNANGGTVNFNSSSSVALSCGNKTFNLVTLNNTNFLNIGSDCTLPLGNNPTTGRLTLNGTLTGSGTLTSTGGNSNLNNGGAFVGFSGLSLSTTTINGLYDFSGYTTFSTGSFTVSGVGTAIMPHDATFNNLLVLSAGSNFTASSGTMSIGGSTTIDPAATFNANGGTVVFNNSSSAAAACGGAVFNLVSMQQTGTLTVGSDCNLPLGNNPNVTSGGSTILNGTLSGSGTLSTASTFRLNGGGALSGFTGLNTEGINIFGAYDFGSYTTFIINNSMTLQSGAALTAPSGTAVFNSGLTISSGSTFNANGGTVNFNGPTSSTIACSGATFNLVTFTNTGTKLVSSDCTLPLGNNPTIGVGNLKLSGTLSGSGTLTKAYDPSGGALTLQAGYVLSGFNSINSLSTLVIESGTTANFSGLSSVSAGNNFVIESGSTVVAPPLLTVSSDFINGGTFNANGGTVVLNGADQTISGDNTFYNLTKTVTSADTLTFAGGYTVVVEGQLTLKGADSSNLLTLVSDTPDTAWLIDPQGGIDIRLVDVSDSHNIGSANILAYSSHDDGVNTNWSFPDSSVPGTPTSSSAKTDTTPAFSWTASTDGSGVPDHYEIQWSKDVSFSSGVISSTSVVNSCVISVSGCGGTDGLSDGTWYVRVRAINALGRASSFSSIGSFKIDTSSPQSSEDDSSPGSAEGSNTGSLATDTTTSSKKAKHTDKTPTKQTSYPSDTSNYGNNPNIVPDEHKTSSDKSGHRFWTAVFFGTTSLLVLLILSVILKQIIKFG